MKGKKTGWFKAFCYGLLTVVVLGGLAVGATYTVKYFTEKKNATATVEQINIEQEALDVNTVKLIEKLSE